MTLADKSAEAWRVVGRAADGLQRLPAAYWTDDTAEFNPRKVWRAVQSYIDEWFAACERELEEGALPYPLLRCPRCNQVFNDHGLHICTQPKES